MNRISSKLEQLRKQNRKALTLFLTAGYPDREATVDLVLGLEDAGADIIELGMPFSDPLADGPVIQECSSIAVRNGVTLDTIFLIVQAIRSQSSIPLVLMGYVNPLMRYGGEKFFASAAQSGVDGFIFPEVPLEETARFAKTIASHGLSNILLVAPTSSPSRIEQIDAASSGFVYCVSSTGVTGVEGRMPAIEYIRLVRKHVKKNPLLVGFGISSPEQAYAYACEADGVIVGSALLRKIMAGTKREDLFRWVREMRRAV